MTPTTRALVCATCALTLLACGENNTTVSADDNTSGGDTSSNDTAGTNNTSSNDTSSTNNGDTTPMTTLPELLSSLNEIADQYGCKVAFTCPEEQPFSLLEYGIFADEQECLAGPNLPFWAPLDIEELEDSIASGRITVDLTVLQQCADDFSAEITADPCAADPNAIFELGICPAAFTGTVATGGDCLTPLDCADGALCDVDADEDTCFGTCTATIGFGQACDPGFEADTPCERGATCVADQGGDGSAGTCIEDLTVVEGDYCGLEDIVCEGDLLCDFDTELCVPPPSAVILMAGGECDAFSNEEFCPAGSVCTDVDENTELGTCGAPRGVGEDCDVFSSTCAPGLFCQLGEQDPFAGTCRALLADGDMCAFELDCASSRCEDGVCASTLACMVP